MIDYSGRAPFFINAITWRCIGEKIPHCTHELTNQSFQQRLMSVGRVPETTNLGKSSELAAKRCEGS